MSDDYEESPLALKILAGCYFVPGAIVIGFFAIPAALAAAGPLLIWLATHFGVPMAAVIASTKAFWKEEDPVKAGVAAGGEAAAVAALADWMRKVGEIFNNLVTMPPVQYPPRREILRQFGSYEPQPRVAVSRYRRGEQRDHKG